LKRVIAGGTVEIWLGATVESIVWSREWVSASTLNQRLDRMFPILTAGLIAMVATVFAQAIL